VKTDSAATDIIPMASCTGPSGARTGQSGVPHRVVINFSSNSYFELGPINTLPNRPFEGEGTQETYQASPYTFPSATTIISVDAF
jgi:hypothetical protein